MTKDDVVESRFDYVAAKLLFVVTKTNHIRYKARVCCDKEYIFLMHGFGYVATKNTLVTTKVDDYLYFRPRFGPFPKTLY